jgi:hypothetical protein
VSGKGSSYYGCLNALRRSCDNKVLIARKRLEDKFVAALNESVLQPEVLEIVYERTAKKIKARGVPAAKAVEALVDGGTR